MPKKKRGFEFYVDPLVLKVYRFLNGIGLILQFNAKALRVSPLKQRGPAPSRRELES